MSQLSFINSCWDVGIRGRRRKENGYNDNSSHMDFSLEDPPQKGFMRWHSAHERISMAAVRVIVQAFADAVGGKILLDAL